MRAGAGEMASAPPWDAPLPDAALANTTIGVVVTNGRLTKGECLLVAQSGHDGLARALDPVHATLDGDALVAAATGVVGVEAPLGLEALRRMAAAAVEDATRAAPGVPGGSGG